MLKIFLSKTIYSIILCTFYVFWTIFITHLFSKDVEIQKVTVKYCVTVQATRPEFSKYLGRTPIRKITIFVHDTCFHTAFKDIFWSEGPPMKSSKSSGKILVPSNILFWGHPSYIVVNFDVAWGPKTYGHSIHPLTYRYMVSPLYIPPIPAYMAFRIQAKTLSKGMVKPLQSQSKHTRKVYRVVVLSITPLIHNKNADLCPYFLFSHIYKWKRQKGGKINAGYLLEAIRKGQSR